MSNVNMQCLPNYLDLNNLSFSDEQWYSFTEEQRNSINALRRLRNEGNNNSNNETGNGGDDISSLGDPSVSRISDGRHLYKLVQLPPAPTGGAPTAPDGNPGTHNNANVAQGSGNQRSTSSIRSTNAGNAFGRDL